MNYFDLALILIIAGFALYGFWFGLVRTVLSLVGTVVGVIAATRLYNPVSDWIIVHTGWSQNIAKVIIFILVFIIIVRLVSLAFWLIEKFVVVFTKIPIIHGLDKFLGFVFGTIEGAIILSLVLYFVARYPLWGGFMQALSASWLAPRLAKITAILLPLMPSALKMLKSTVSGII